MARRARGGWAASVPGEPGARDPYAEPRPGDRFFVRLPRREGVTGRRLRWLEVLGFDVEAEQLVLDFSAPPSPRRRRKPPLALLARVTTPDSTLLLRYRSPAAWQRDFGLPQRRGRVRLERAAA